MARGKGTKAQSRFWSLKRTVVVGTPQQMVSVAACPARKALVPLGICGRLGLNVVVRSLSTTS